MTLCTFRAEHLSVNLGPHLQRLRIGGGNGAAALHIADTFGLQVVGGDVDYDQIARARQASGGRRDVVVLTPDATNLPFEDDCFDIVATHKTTDHIPGWPEALRDEVLHDRPRCLSSRSME